MAENYSTAVVKLFRFLRLFDITMFSVLEATGEYVRAVVAWEDGCEGGIPVPEEVQEVLWHYGTSPISEDSLLVAEYAYNVDLVHADKPKIDADTVSRALGWNRERVDSAIAELLMIRVDMVDDDEVTDAFQLHQ